MPKTGLKVFKFTKSMPNWQMIQYLTRVVDYQAVLSIFRVNQVENIGGCHESF